MTVLNIDDYIKPGRRAHLVGIGGVSMSPLAEVLHGAGMVITGSDMHDSATVEHLRSLGIHVTVGHRAENVAGAELVIRTAAVHDVNPEIAAAREAGIPVFERAQAWGSIMKHYRNALCSFAFEGETGMYTMQNLMKTLRADPPKEIAGYAVERVADYDTDGTGLPRANVLEYHLAGGHKLMVRPSGTEPKIKVYLSAVGKSEAEADAVNAELAKAAEMLMK